jgi:hypothetical protein
MPWEARSRASPRARASAGTLLRDFAARVRAMRGMSSPSPGLSAPAVQYAVASELPPASPPCPASRASLTRPRPLLVDLNRAFTYFDLPPRHVAARRDAGRTLALRELAIAVAFEHHAILIDNLHWWDESSAALIAAFADGLGDAKIVLVTADVRERAPFRPVRRATSPSSPSRPPVRHSSSVLPPSLRNPGRPGSAPSCGARPALWRWRYSAARRRQLLRRTSGAWQTDRPGSWPTSFRPAMCCARIEDMDGGDRWLLALLAGGRTARPDTLVGRRARHEVSHAPGVVGVARPRRPRRRELEHRATGSR